MEEPARVGQQSGGEASEERTTRRGSLYRLGGLVAAAVTGGTLAGDALGADESAAGPAAVAAGLVSCVLAPETTAGPFFLDGDRVRRDVREGRPGTLLTLRTTVVDASTCKPIRNAKVDIWHCDAKGVYAGFAEQGTEGETFLHGIQPTDAKGLAVFTTVYPGWYPGRAVHIHVRVYLGGSIVHTGQLFFPDAITDQVYKRAPYSSRPGRDPRNAGDAIFRNGGSRSLLRLRRVGAGWVGTITMGVVRA